jgi:hypothetical protein
VAKKKVGEKVCKPDTAILHMVSVASSTTFSYDQTYHHFGGALTSAAVECNRYRPVTLRYSASNTTYTDEDSQDAGYNGEWQFSYDSEPAYGYYRLDSPEMTAFPGEPDDATGDLTVSVCAGLSTTPFHWYG